MFKIEPHYIKKPWGSLSLESNETNNTNDKIGEVFLYAPSLISNRVKSTLKFNVPNILLKFIFAKEWLSIQVHPNDEQAKTLENQENGKNEAWYFLNPGTVISGVSESFAKSNSNITNLFDSNNYVFTEVKEAQFMNIPAGTVHAIGPNMQLFEIQQPSDITYRIYDWDENKLRNRELHLDKANKVLTNNISKPINSSELDEKYFKCFIKEFNYDAYTNDKPCVLICLNDLKEKAILLYPNYEIKLNGKYMICMD